MSPGWLVASCPFLAEMVPFSPPFFFKFRLLSPVTRCVSWQFFREIKVISVKIWTKDSCPYSRCVNGSTWTVILKRCRLARPTIKVDRHFCYNTNVFLQQTWTLIILFWNYLNLCKNALKYSWIANNCLNFTKWDSCWLLPSHQRSSHWSQLANHLEFFFSSPDCSFTYSALTPIQGFIFESTSLRAQQASWPGAGQHHGQRVPLCVSSTWLNLTRLVLFRLWIKEVQLPALKPRRDEGRSQRDEIRGWVGKLASQI